MEMDVLASITQGRKSTAEEEAAWAKLQTGHHLVYVEMWKQFSLARGSVVERRNGGRNSDKR